MATKRVPWSTAFRLVFATTTLCLSARGCSTGRPAEPDEFTNASYRYPVGSSRADVLARVGEPQQSGLVADETDPGLRAYVRDLERATGRRVVRRDVYAVSRRVGSGSMSAVCLEFDSVFYDDADWVVAVVTRHGTC